MSKVLVLGIFGHQVITPFVMYMYRTQYVPLAKYKERPPLQMTWLLRYSPAAAPVSEGSILMR